MEKRDKISHEEKEKIIYEWLNSHWVGDKKCPICLHNEWNVNTKTGSIMTQEDKTVNLGEFYPFLIINCSYCGYSFFMNEVIIGISSPLTDTKEVK
jgi:hypothetical protein